MSKKFYSLVALEYDEKDCIRDREWYLSEKNNYQEVYEDFVKLQSLSDEDFFEKFPKNVYQICLQLEECIETKDGIECLDVKNEIWIKNPDFRKGELEIKEAHKEWLLSLYDREIEETKIDMSNHFIWLKGAKNKEDEEMEKQNIQNLSDYIEILKKLKEKVEGSDII